MASFLENMRMNTLYPTEYYNPKLKFELQRLQNEQNQQLNQPNPIQPRINPQLMTQMQQPQGMNVVLGDQGNPQGAINAAEDRINLWEDRPWKKKLAEDQLKQKEDKQNQDIGFKNAKLLLDTNIKQQRANVYEFKAKHPEMKIMIPKGGNIVAIDPITGKSMDLGIDSGTLTDKEKIELTQEGSLAKIQESGRQQRDTENTRQGNRIELAGVQNQNQKSLIETRAETQKPLLPNQTAKDRVNKAAELANSHPEYAPFIKMTPDGAGFIITPPSSGVFGKSGPDMDTYHKINEFIYGNSEPEKKSDKTQTPSKLKVEQPKSKYKVTIIPGKK